MEKDQKYNQAQPLLNYHPKPIHKTYIPREFLEQEDGQLMSPTEGLLELKHELNKVIDDGLDKTNDLYYFYLGSSIAIADIPINSN